MTCPVTGALVCVGGVPCAYDTPLACGVPCTVGALPIGGVPAFIGVAGNAGPGKIVISGVGVFVTDFCRLPHTLQKTASSGRFVPQ